MCCKDHLESILARSSSIQTGVCFDVCVFVKVVKIVWNSVCNVLHPLEESSTKISRMQIADYLDAYVRAKDCKDHF